MQLLYWIAGVYVVICVAGYFGNRMFMYFPDPARYTPAEAGLPAAEEIELSTSDGDTLVAWYAKARPGKPTILYFHGNAGNAANRAPKVDVIPESGYGLFYLNNRGYGGSSGRPSEEKNIADALLAYDHLTGLGVKGHDIVAYGESLGSGQVVRLAAQRPLRAAILEAPLVSTPAVAQSTYFFLPLRLLLTDQWRNEDHIRGVQVPVLVLHGAQDRVIPVDHGRRVYDAANEPKQLELFPQGAHSDLFDHGAWEKAREFLESLQRQ